MRLLDKIAKKLGYVPAETLIKPQQVIKQELPLKTFTSNIHVSRYDLKCLEEDRFDMDRWAKRKIVENLTNELLSCMDFVEEVDRDGNITIRGRIRVVDDRSM